MLLLLLLLFALHALNVEQIVEVQSRSRRFVAMVLGDDLAQQLLGLAEHVCACANALRISATHGQEHRQSRHRLRFVVGACAQSRGPSQHFLRFVQPIELSQQAAQIHQHTEARLHENRVRTQHDNELR